MNSDGAYAVERNTVPPNEWPKYNRSLLERSRSHWQRHISEIFKHELDQRLVMMNSMAGQVLRSGRKESLDGLGRRKR